MKIGAKQSIGLFSATCLVIGNMLGSGVYMMPANMAHAGGAISLVSWLIILIGIMSLSLCFVKLNVLSKNHGGGPYYYVQMGFGFIPAYVINFIYIIANLIAITSMLSIINGALSLMFGHLLDNYMLPTLIELLIVWGLTILNIRGAKIVAILQSSGISFVLLPIILVIIFGGYYFNWEIFSGNINPEHLSILTVTNNAYNNIMWAFIGVESAVIVANIVNNPTKNIPIATIAAVFTVAIIYIGVYICSMGILDNNTLNSASTPLILVIRKLFANKILEDMLIVTAIIDCISSILGWLLVTSHAIARSAQDGLINQYFSKLNRYYAPYRSLLAGAIVVSVTIISTISTDALEQFNKIINASVALYLIAYIGSMLAILLIMLKQKVAKFREKISYVILSIIATLFCVYSLYITDIIYLIISFMVMFLGLLLSLRSEKKC